MNLALLEENYDVVVVGTGPAGASSAKVCSEEGLKVALIEKNPQAGQKLCAGGIESKVLKEFEIEDHVIECYPRRFCICGEKRWIVSEEESATVYRRNFDRYLADRAVAAGAREFTLTRCLKVTKDNQKVVGIVVKTPKGLNEVRCKVVIAADGFYSVTARSAGLQRRYRPSDVGLAVQFETYARSKVKDDTVYLFYGDKISACGYGWIYPKKYGYTVGIGCLLSRLNGNLTRNLEYLVHKHSIASRILSKVSEISKLEAACIPLNPRDNICGDGILVVGDAAGQVSPLAGNGIYYAMKAGALAGRVATEAVSENDASEERLREYQKTWHSQFGEELKRQKKILEKIEDQYSRYMKVQIFLESYPRIKRIWDAGLKFVKPFFLV